MHIGSELKSQSDAFARGCLVVALATLAHPVPVLHYADDTVSCMLNIAFLTFATIAWAGAGSKLLPFTKFPDDSSSSLRSLPVIAAGAALSCAPPRSCTSTRTWRR